MVTERYPSTDEHTDCAKVRFAGEFFCATYPFLFSKNKKILIRPRGPLNNTIEYSQGGD